MKVFDVVLNGDLTVTSDLDIFEKVGRGVAHDEYVEFSVESNKIIYQGEESEISAGKIRVEMIKSYRDNPKINAIILIKGTLSDWPKLPPLPVEQEEDELADELKVSKYSSKQFVAPLTHNENKLKSQPFRSRPLLAGSRAAPAWLTPTPRTTAPPCCRSSWPSAPSSRWCSASASCSPQPAARCTLLLSGTIIIKNPHRHTLMQQQPY